ncbi:sensor domain-containing diguanylate cyclase [bacterium]|nr:sensor domain-containing diguanylate cyclase [bacterium]
MLNYFKQHSKQRWVLPAAVIGAYPGLVVLVMITNQLEWLSLAVLIPIVGILGIRPAVGNSLMAFTILFFWVAGLREVDQAVRSGMWFHVPVVVLTWVFCFIYQHRTHEKELGYESAFSDIEERLILIREQYKTDLVVNVSNQKKNQKYSLLNRVSRVLGSQLQLDKLADKIMREVREIIGAEGGHYLLVMKFPDKSEPLIRGITEEQEFKKITEDQYGAWTTQHRSTLLVTDTNNDFRFKSLGPQALVRSLMLAPMQSEGHLIGVLRAESPRPDIFSQDDVRLFTIIADLAGVSAENARLYQYAQELAMTDGLTGLYLRRFFNQRFEEELSRYREHGTSFSLLILDLDHFKRINDRMGHLAGDQILAQLGERLRAEARVADLLCRFGGEEFAVILSNTNVEGALVMAERIRSHIAQHEFIAAGTSLHITISVGVGECPRHGVEMNELVRVTDAALYQAKRSGRNRVILAGGAA